MYFMLLRLLSLCVRKTHLKRTLFLLLLMALMTNTMPAYFNGQYSTPVRNSRGVSLDRLKRMMCQAHPRNCPSGYSKRNAIQPTSRKLSMYDDFYWWIWKLKIILDKAPIPELPIDSDINGESYIDWENLESVPTNVDNYDTI
ncbi:unnamed protein product [Owenia fusiformis]|uniref:Uncharacterized protein n=1 Tax=Owenia fusiformis TaxID=6347 RepID=A0A8J1V0F4_OWEFU|nr:unnamed protein product [Owenia fusiformis]